MYTINQLQFSKTYLMIHNWYKVENAVYDLHYQGTIIAFLYFQILFHTYFIMTQYHLAYNKNTWNSVEILLLRHLIILLFI